MVLTELCLCMLMKVTSNQWGTESNGVCQLLWCTAVTSNDNIAGNGRF